VGGGCASGLAGNRGGAVEEAQQFDRTAPDTGKAGRAAAPDLDADAPLPVPGLPTPALPASIPASADLTAPAKTPATA